MKIISSHQDYYDWAGMGIDETIVFERPLHESLHFADRNGLPDPIVLRDWVGNYEKEVYITPVYALVGGIGIPGFSITHWFDHSEQTTQYSFEASEVLELLTTHTAEFDRFAHREVTRRSGDFLQFMAPGRRDLTDFCAEHRLVAGLLSIDRWAFRSRACSEDEPVRFDAVLLQSLGIQDLLPPQEAHMMISRFVGGILTAPQRIEEPSDTVKIVKKGFDKKVSFRTRKTKTR